MERERVPFFKVVTKNKTRSFFSKERGTERVPQIRGTTKALSIECQRDTKLLCSICIENGDIQVFSFFIFRK